MNTWTRTLIVGVALLAGCEGSIGGSKTNGAGSGGSSGRGTGNTTVGSGRGDTTGSGTAGTGVLPPPVDPTVCTPGVPATSQIPRLTRAEYDKTTRDLLGLDAPRSSVLAPDALGSVDQRAGDGFKPAAAAVAPRVLSAPAAKAKVLPCTTDN